MKLTRFSPDLIGVELDGGEKQLWSRAVTRTARVCAKCKDPISKGVECFRPLTNENNRWERLCVKCADGAKKEYDRKPGKKRCSKKTKR
jgi:hypothetical protein